jgi:hypothetical protein
VPHTGHYELVNRCVHSPHLSSLCLHAFDLIMYLM